MEAAKETAIFMHCMPIHEWEEVSEDVAKSKQSVILDEAEKPPSRAKSYTSLVSRRSRR